ncbi:MAG: AAA family ATPase [Halobacteria archaeon]|nr:AAA family ATPase [Halobacteria archaeon]
MKITVSGPPGSGTTTLSKALSSEFGLEHISSGDVFREMAEERGVTLATFNEMAEEDPDIDRQIDLRQREIGDERDDIILEGRLSGWMVEGADVKIWLKAPLRVRAGRVAEREEISVDQAYDEIKAREESEKKRYKEIHGIDIDDLSIYDLVIDTSHWDAEGVVSIARRAIKEFNLTSDDL